MTKLLLKKLLQFIALYIFMLFSMLTGFLVEYSLHTTSSLSNYIEATKLYFLYDFSLPLPPVSLMQTLIIYILILILRKVYLSKKIYKIVKIIVVASIVFITVYVYIFSLTAVYSLT